MKTDISVPRLQETAAGLFTYQTNPVHMNGCLGLPRWSFRQAFFQHYDVCGPGSVVGVATR
jgi:hypothetical protein